MKIIIRVDASVQMGTGHVMRCLTLADALTEKGATISFVCRELPGDLCSFIEEKGYRVHRLLFQNEDKNSIKDGTRHGAARGTISDLDAQGTEAILKMEGDVRWLIVDHYALDKQWEKYLRPYVNKIMAIDDLADRPHDCDLLLDQNLYDDMETRYDGLVPASCQKLFGPKYALLRPEFVKTRENPRKRDGTIRHILINFGGADADNMTEKALEAVRLLNRPDVPVDVVVGSSNPHKDSVKKLCASMPNTRYYCQVENMAEMMVRADLCLGAGGTSVWERCCIALPNLTVSIAQNQVHMNTTMGRNTFILYGGWHKDVTAQRLHEDILFLFNHQELVAWFSLQSKSLVDGNGSSRVRRFLLYDFQSLRLRRVTMKDCKIVYELRNDPRVRKYSFSSSPLEWEKHKQWFEKKMKSRNTDMFLAMIKDTAVGVLRYDLNGPSAKASIYLEQGQIGMGLGTLILQQGNKWLKETYPKIESVIAEIAIENTASMKAFEHAGFQKNHVTYIYHWGKK